MTNADNASVQVFKIVDPGHVYDLLDIFGGGNHQRVTFLKKKRKEGSTTGELETVFTGTTNEAVILMMINRLESLDKTLADKFTQEAIDSLHKALGALNNRTHDRRERGVEGTSNA